LYVYSCEAHPFGCILSFDSCTRRPHPPAEQGSNAVLLAEVVETHKRVGGTKSRDQKTQFLAEILARADETQIPILVGLLTGSPRQGRVGIGPGLFRHLQVTDSPGIGAPLQVTDVDAALDAVANATGPGSHARKQEVLSELMARGNQEEQAFIARLLLGGLRQGAADGLVQEAAAKAAGVDSAQLRDDVLRLGTTAAAAAHHLTDASAEPAEPARTQLFQPLAPMLAGSVEAVDDALAAFAPALLEAKADGARVQVHRRGDEVRVYTRSLNEITLSVPEVVEAARALPGDELILDGEVLAWGPEGPFPFQVTMRRVGAKSTDHEVRQRWPLRVFWFDCLWADGEELLDRPLEARRAVLEARVPDEQLLPSRTLSAVEAAGAETFFDHVVAAGFEGLMVKDLSAPYSAGRRGSAWLKVKPVHTLDLVVLGAEWGGGRRRGWLSNLHLGARDEETGQFVMLGKTFKGMTDEILEWQTRALRDIESDRRKDTIFVRPEYVVEIAFEGVQRSTRYPGGVSLRFARLRGYRHDKRAHEADTLATVRSLLADVGGPEEVLADALPEIVEREQEAVQREQETVEQEQEPAVLEPVPVETIEADRAPTEDPSAPTEAAGAEARAGRRPRGRTARSAQQLEGQGDLFSQFEALRSP